MAEVPFLQIDLHRSKSTSAVLTRCLAKMHIGIALIQKPLVLQGTICGLGRSRGIVQATPRRGAANLRPGEGTGWDSGAQYGMQRIIKI